MNNYSRLERLHIDQLPGAAYMSVQGLSAGHGNEDAIRAVHDSDGIRACIADGHWGDDAARQAVAFFTGAAAPASRQEAIAVAGQFEEQVYRQFGWGDMQDIKVHRTPEAAVTSIAISDSVLSIASYGDCGLLVARNQRVHYQMPQVASWLGCYSYLGLRERLPVSEAVVYKEVPLEQGDSVLLYTDGLSEWAHNEQPMITPEGLAYNMFGSAADIATRLARMALTQGSAGTEDDCTLFVYQHDTKSL
jgi:serine/threonine protein phosphatase PrpC